MKERDLTMETESYAVIGVPEDEGRHPWAKELSSPISDPLNYKAVSFVILSHHYIFDSWLWQQWKANKTPYSAECLCASWGEIHRFQKILKQSDKLGSTLISTFIN